MAKPARVAAVVDPIEATWKKVHPKAKTDPLGRPLRSAARVHFTIGLLPSLVVQLDEIVAARGLRNRSDAVEFLLERYRAKAS